MRLKSCTFKSWRVALLIEEHQAPLSILHQKPVKLFNFLQQHTHKYAEALHITKNFFTVHNIMQLQLH